ncbi:MAG TPA: dTDP-4-dehydrorhamnose reductase [Candidatus Andersenbacteria bacterium]|nr:dTDP-4-dehydrorhamnose reductase [Candidatus Andersenbacteria bacterium]
MRVLILGSRGMLGRQLVGAFDDLDTIGWDKEELDITDAKQVQEKVSALRPHLIINAAAYTNVDGAETERESAFAVNEVGVRNVAQAAKEVGAKMVHYSTDYVFSGEREEGYAEDDVPDAPVNAYGESKLAGERALAEIKPDYYLIRTAWLYGAGGKNFVDTILRLGREKPELKVVDDQRGSPTYTVDLADATRMLVDAHEPGVYHAVNAGETSWYEFAREIFQQAGLDTAVKPIPSAEYPLPAKRPRQSILRNTRGPQLPEWQCALRDYLDSLQLDKKAI